MSPHPTTPTFEIVIRPSSRGAPRAGRRCRPSAAARHARRAWCPVVHPAAQHRLEARPLLRGEHGLPLLDRAEPRDPEVDPELRHLPGLGLGLGEVHGILLEERPEIELGDPDVGVPADRLPRELPADGLEPRDLLGGEPELGPVMEHDGDEGPLRWVPHHPPGHAHGAAPLLDLLDEVGAEAAQAPRQLVDEPASLFEAGPWGPPRRPSPRRSPAPPRSGGRAPSLSSPSPTVPARPDQS